MGRHAHRTDQNRSGGTLLGANGSDQSHSRGYGRSTREGRAELLTNPNTRPGRAPTRSGHFGDVEPRLYSFGGPPSRTAGRRSRIVTWALPQTGPRARPLDAGYFRQGLVPAISFRRGWGCSPARLAEYRARLAAGLRPEQVDALLSDPVDHHLCRDTDLPECHVKRPSCVSVRSVTEDGAPRIAEQKIPFAQGSKSV